MSIYSPSDIALKSSEQIDSMTKAELHECAKTLGLKGYSKLNKPELVNLVFNASDILRQSYTIADSNYKASQKQKEFKSSEYIDKAEIFALLKKLSPQQYSDYLYNIFDNAIVRGDLKPSSVATNIKTALFNTLDEMLEDEIYHLSKETVIEIKEAVKERNRPYNFAKKELEKSRINEYAYKAEKSLNATPIIQWALKALDSTRHEWQALALSILSGRRMVEIYGTANYSLADNGLIRIDGLAKKKKDSNDSCEFIPLCDAKKWLSVWENLENKGKTPTQVNNTNARMVSRNYPYELKELGIDKFKDCRDFYAGLGIVAFKEAGYAMPEHFVMKIMGHESGESTKYYRKFDVSNIPNNIIKKYGLYELA